MAARKKAKRVRRSRTFRVLNALEAATYGAIVMKGVTGYSNPIAFFSDAPDIQEWHYAPTGATGVHGLEQIGLQDIVSEPGMALAKIQSNLSNNFIPMALASFTTGLTFRLGKMLLRRPVSSINRNIMKPLFGKAVAL
jgi:hypothetical protein